MPVTYTIDQEAALVRMQCSGILTNQELIDGLERCTPTRRGHGGMPSLVDCRGVERMLLTSAGLEAAVALESVLVDPAQQPWAVAIVAPQDEVYWVARTYEVLRAGSPETVRVFRDASDAEDWLQHRSG